MAYRAHAARGSRVSGLRDLPQYFLKIGLFDVSGAHFFCKFMAACNGSIPVHSKVRYFRWFSIIRLAFKVHHFHFFS